MRHQDESKNFGKISPILGGAGMSICLRSFANILPEWTDVSRNMFFFARITVVEQRKIRRISNK
jgi:hypothetical protein